MAYLGQTRRRSERGFSMLQLVVTLSIISIVLGFALVSVNSARANMRLQNSVRLLAGYMEKARLDAVRRHDTASVVFTSTTSYNVAMDFGGTGVVQTRTYTFDDGVSIISTPLPSVSFNWRGRTSACTLTFALQDSSGDQSWVDVSDAGDVTVNSNVDTLPTPSYTNVNASADVYSSTVVTGTTVHNNTADCGGSGSSGTAPPITGSGAGGCSVTANPSSLTIKKNGGSSGTVTVSPTAASTVTVSGPSNLSISPASSTIGAGGTGSFSISSNNKTRGTFAVTFSSACTSVTVLVKVTN
jgi:type IV fimbrial biogenesis protein FimT